jgi:signal peptidase II
MWWAIVLGMLLGGALGNLVDRLFREPGFGRGHVVDFISTPWMMPAIYNVADSFICISMVLFVLLVILGVNLDGSRTLSAQRQAEADAAEPLDGGAAFAPAPVDVEEPTRASRPDERDRRDTLGHDAT